MLHVTEIFHSVQGESTQIGRRCVFVRLTGCNLRCVWCDTEYAFHGGQPMTQVEILDRVRSFGCSLVELTGGEPMLQPEAVPLMQALIDAGYEVMLETGGSLPLDSVPQQVRRIIDVKCPASGESERNHFDTLRDLRPRDELKFVIADRADYDWARSVLEEYRLSGEPVILFSPVHGGLEAGEMARWVIEDRLPVRVQLQLHKALWPGEERGV